MNLPWKKLLFATTLDIRMIIMRKQFEHEQMLTKPFDKIIWPLQLTLSCGNIPQFKGLRTAKI